MTATSSVVVVSVLSMAVLCHSQTSIQFEESGQCTTQNGTFGTCINIKECPQLLKILKNQQHQPGVATLLRNSTCGYEGFDSIVCCPENGPSMPPKRARTQPAIMLPTSNECGFSNISHSRIVGGVAAVLDAWPWVVALGYRNNRRNTDETPRFLCGASLITNRHVLTAAHCVHKRKDLYIVRLGDLDLESDDDGAKPIDILISDKKVHENYNPTSYINDIALVTLESSVPCSEKIHPICLPVAPDIKARDFLRTSPFIAGWGAKNFEGPTSTILRQVQIPVVDLPKCKEAFTRFSTAVIDDRVMCAGYEQGGKDACQGDSGGPLMWQMQFTYYQIGIVSYGYQCAEPGVPGVYTRISAFMDWITKNIK